MQVAEGLVIFQAGCEAEQVNQQHRNSCQRCKKKYQLTSRRTLIATQANGGMWDGQRQTTGTGTLLSYRLSGTSAAAHMASKLEMLDRHDFAI